MTSACIRSLVSRTSKRDVRRFEGGRPGCQNEEPASQPDKPSPEETSQITMSCYLPPT